MATLQVSFHDTKLVKKVKVASRSNDIVNRLNRTKKELNPDLAGEREAYDREVRTGTNRTSKALDNVDSEGSPWIVGAAKKESADRCSKAGREGCQRAGKAGKGSQII